MRTRAYPEFPVVKGRIDITRYEYDGDLMGAFVEGERQV